MPYLKAFKEVGVFNSFKAERKAKFNSSFLSVYLLSPWHQLGGWLRGM